MYTYGCDNINIRTLTIISIQLYVVEFMIMVYQYLHNVIRLLYGICKVCKVCIVL